MSSSTFESSLTSFTVNNAIQYCTIKVSYTHLQVVLGEELESERYLITIEEKLNPSSDHSHEVTLKTQENEVERSVGPLYQPGKRKRRVCILTLWLVPVKTAFLMSVLV